jgi:prevent-host-death family protein
MKRVSVLEFRRKLDHYIDRVARDKAPLLVCRAGEPLVAMIPAEDLGQYQREAERRAKREEAARKMDEVRESQRKRGESVDVVRLIRQMRDSR